MTELAGQPDEATLRRDNRAALEETMRLFATWDHERPSAAEGGYAEGRYADRYTEDGELILPFMPDGLTKSRAGTAAHLADAEFRFRLFKEFEWIHLEIVESVDPNRFVVFASSKGKTGDGISYGNDYVFDATMEAGRLRVMREYADPIRLLALVDTFPADGQFRTS